MPKPLSRLPMGVQAATVHTLYALPGPLRRMFAGSPVRIDGNELALDAQLLTRVFALTGTSLSADTVELARRNVETGSPIAAGPVIQPVRVRDLRIPADGREIPARLYTPDGLEAGSPLLVYFHGGGFVVGSIESYDNTCRFLAQGAEVRVLSVGYRLAPEHPFPAAPADAFAAFAYAARHAEELGADASSIAVGGDSAGGNLAAVTSYQALRTGGPRPAFQLLFYPRTDLEGSYRSHELFAERFFLTAHDIEWCEGHYGAAAGDPLASPLLAEDLRGLPPTYIATAGFDVLRDEGDAYAARLTEAGVPVVHHCHTDLIHGFVNFIGLGRRFREAVAEAAGALRTGLALRAGSSSEDLFGKRRSKNEKTR